MSFPLELSRQRESNDDVLKSVLRSKFSDFPIRFSEVTVRKGTVSLIFAKLEQAFSYELKLLEDNNWDQPFTISSSSLTINRIATYTWKNIIRLGAYESILCIEKVRSALRSTLENLPDSDRIYVGCCSTRNGVFLISSNARQKNLYIDLINRHGYVFAGQKLKNLQVHHTKSRTRKRDWDKKKAIVALRSTWNLPSQKRENWLTKWTRLSESSIL